MTPSNSNNRFLSSADVSPARQSSNKFDSALAQSKHPRPAKFKQVWLCFLLIGTSVLLTSPAGYAQSGNPVSFSLFLVGHSESLDLSDPHHLQFLQTILNYNNNKKGIIFLGNNFSVSESDDSNSQPTVPWLDSLRRFDGPVGFIPGKSDWAGGSSEGKNRIKWEYTMIYDQLDGKDVYMPDAACPGPVEITVSDSLTIILTDMQWWLHPFDTRLGKCDLEEKDDFWILLQDALRRNRNKQVVVAGYYPLVSSGEFGGYFPSSKKIFGFPEVLYRKYLGARYDLAHPEYRELRNDLKMILEQFPDIIYASSHEKNFQYIFQNNIHQIIGGSLTGGGYAEEKRTGCSSERAGFSRLDFYGDGKVELLFFPLDEPDQPLCRNTLYCYQSTTPGQTEQTTESTPDSIIHAASRQYIASPGKEKWMGKNYREVWSTPVKIPVFDRETEHGGLEIVKRGGGQQTHSIQVEDADGHAYALRSLEKYVEGALPRNVHHTFAVDVVQDNISASNPYAAMPVAGLAGAAGILHTNPKVLFVPHDYRLGEYMEDLAGHAFLFEEKPSGDWSDTESFGFSKDIVGTDDVLDKMTGSPKHQVDQQAVLKARLFDTFINDWDRHDDQWRWASYKQQGKTVYRPIPRDRDQAFYVNEGILPWIASRKWLMPKIQGFAPMTKNMEGLVFNARYFDRTFLTQPGWNDWSATVDTLQTLLTDEQIDEAMKAFPKEVQPLVASRTAGILKRRRDNLEQMARQHYLTLAKNVDITGTDKDDRFEVIRKNDRQTIVSVYSSKTAGSQNQPLPPLSPEAVKGHSFSPEAVKDQPQSLPSFSPEVEGDQNRPWYHRVFQADETREIRLYGLKGDDHFMLKGNTDKGIMIRIIGGKGKDTINNLSLVKKPGKQTRVYDLKKNTIVNANRDTRVKLSANKSVNDYDRMTFRYDVVSPGLFMGYNADDGIFIGGGPVFNYYRFRRHNTQSVMANFATRTNAFNVRYLFDSESETRGFDHHAGLELKAPDYAMNYFGMGNESKKDDAFPDSYYRLNVNQLILNYGLGYRWGKSAFREMKDGKINEHEARFGLFFKRSHIEERPNRFISDLDHNGLTWEDLRPLLFSGLYGQYFYSNLDREVNPQRGFKLDVSGEQFFQMNQDRDHFLRLNADLRTYISFTQRPRAVLALRAGVSKIFGDYAFLEAAKLGGKTNLRGYLADRFYGDGAVWQNSEFRYKLLDFSSYILNGELGVLAFYDSGRVWVKDEGSSYWHRGYGSGVWLSPFEMTIFTATYNWSSEDSMLQVTLNFKF